MILRRAKVFANVLQEIPIFIEENTLIAGNGASKPMGLEIDPENPNEDQLKTIGVDESQNPQND